MHKYGAAVLAAFLLILVASTSHARSYYYQLDHGRRAPISIETNPATTDWVVLMPGSGCNFYEIADTRFMTWLKGERPFNILLIGKTGADINKTEDSCRVDEFQHSSVRSQRIKDNQTIMHDLIPPTSRILLAAISEGAYIAPDVAFYDHRVKAYIDLSGNTQSWMTEEIMCIPPGPEREKLAKFFDTEVRGNNSFTKYYVDWTYAYLNSYDTHQAYDMMKALQIPITWLNGDADSTLWVEGARQDAMDLINNQGKENIEYHWLAGAEHGLHCSETVKSCDDAALQVQVKQIITDFTRRNF
jgi:hypothetical protein